MLNQKLRRVAVGQPLARSLRGVVFHAGMSDQFEVVSFPDEEFYRITVFRLDESGQPFYEGSRMKGFEFFRIEIQSPSVLDLSLFNEQGKQLGASKRSGNLRFLTPKEVLENRLCDFYLKSMRSRG